MNVLITFSGCHLLQNRPNKSLDLLNKILFSPEIKCNVASHSQQFYRYLDYTKWTLNHVTDNIIKWQSISQH